MSVRSLGVWIEMGAQDANQCFGVQTVTLNITSFAIGGIFRDGFEEPPP